MAEVQVLPLRSFEHGGVIRTPRRGAFLMDRRVADQLRALGQVEFVRQPEDPTAAAGRAQSASPAAPASTQTTSSASTGGASKGRRERSAG